MKSAHSRHPKSEAEARLLYAFFASMLWQDGQLLQDDRHALDLMAMQLGLDPDDPFVAALARLPPRAEEVDPQAVPRALTSMVLGVAALGASVRPSLARYEALELLEALLAPAPAPTVLELLAA